MKFSNLGVRNKKRNVFQGLFLGIIILFLFITARYFYNRLYFGEYKTAHKDVYTSYDYFVEMEKDGAISRADFIMYMYTAFIAMLGDKEVAIDNRVIESDMLGCYTLRPIEYSQDDIGILNINCEKEGFNCQKYYLLDANGEKRKLFIFTGEQWENSVLIRIFFDLEGNIIIAPKERFKGENFVDVDLQLKEFSYDTVLIQTGQDTTIQRIAGEGHKKEIVLRQIIFIFFIASVGIVAGKAFFPMAGAMSVWFVLPFGFINQIISTFFLVVLHLKISLLHYIVISYLVAIALNRYVKGQTKQVEGFIKYDKKLLYSLLLWAGVILWFCVRPYIILSYDSVLNSYYGKYAVVAGELNTVLGGLTSYSLITPMFEVGSSLFGIELNYSIQPILTITFMAAIVWIWYRMIEGSTKLKIGIILWVIVALIVNPMFYIQTFWKLNNLSLGLFTGFMVGMHILYYMTSQKVYFDVGNLFLIIVGTSRIEGGLFVAVYLVCLYVLFQNRIKTKEIESLCLKIALVMTAVYLYYLCIIGQTDSMFWTPIKGLAMNILLWIVYLFFKVSPVLGRKLKEVPKNIDRIMLLCIFFSVIVLGVTNWEKFIHNTFAYVCNLGNYGGYWIVVVVAAVFGSLYLKNNVIVRFLAIYILSYFLMIPCLMMFREVPLRIGFGDSACRMLSHVAVVGGFLLIYIVNVSFRDDVVNGCKYEARKL